MAPNTTLVEPDSMRLSLPSLRRSLNARTLGAETSLLPLLGYPLFPNPRIAVIGSPVRPTAGVHYLPAWTPAELAAIRPLAIAAAFPEYERIAMLMRSGEMALQELQYPLLVFSRAGVGALTLKQHDAMWSWFGLPCFEQIRDAEGRLLAYECEARDGFHLTEKARPEEVGGMLVHSQCGCGQISPRVRLAPVGVLSVSTCE